MYGIPHGRGSNLLMCNSETRSSRRRVTPGASVFDPKEAAKYKGKITAYDSPIYIADAAVYLKEHQPDLGIEDPYELDQEQFDAAIDLLKQQNEFIGEYWSDYTKEIQSFANGDLVVGTAWPYQWLTLQADNKPVGGGLPLEGGRDRVVGHLDAELGGQESELHVRVVQPHHAAEGAGRGRGVVR